jgi:hypothetical protein
MQSQRRMFSTRGHISLRTKQTGLFSSPFAAHFPEIHRFSSVASPEVQELREGSTFLKEIGSGIEKTTSFSNSLPSDFGKLQIWAIESIFDLSKIA